MDTTENTEPSPSEIVTTWKVTKYKAKKRADGPFKDTWGVEVEFTLPDDTKDYVIYNIYSSGKNAKDAARRANITGGLVFNRDEPGGPQYFYDPGLHEKYDPNLLTKLTDSLKEHINAIPNTTTSES